MHEAVKILVRGRVQGVGFRPFVFRLAQETGLKGTVQNNMDGVRIVWEGSPETIRSAMKRLVSERPRLSRIDKVTYERAETAGLTDFTILESDRDGKSSLVIPVDSAVCADCLHEMRDPGNFRYRYPFINCTQCGPRYSIIDALPYDRPYTSMKDFPMCGKCGEEYRDPHNRRHHAQPIACDACGPHVSLIEMDGTVLGQRDEAVRLAVRSLESGMIMAIKGIGGYHLACDAANHASVEKLRQRKNRPERPLAIMAASVDAAKRIAVISDREESLLRSPEAPIVLLERSAAYARTLPEALAPGIRTIGVMLPYTPLHHLLFDDGKFSYLVMTSANPSGLPILYEDAPARAYLDGIADRILTNNRPILHAIDDSVVRMSERAPYFLRRSRGYVPDPLPARTNVDGVVALGGQMKNTFALGRRRQIFIGPHLGDLSAVESVEHYEKTLSHLMKWMGIEVKTVAVDMHPFYSTRSVAEKMNKPVVPVQHHHAHLVSCMEENKLEGPVFGVILDGTGYGEDGNIWGFEVLYGDASGYRRLAHLRYTPLPGGDRAVLEPWRNAAGMLIGLLGERGRRLAGRLFPDKESSIAVISRMVSMKLNSPLAGTCGRLFDAVSAILGICTESTYDGEAAIRLSEHLGPGNVNAPPYPFVVTEKSGLKELDFKPMIEQITDERLKGVPPEPLIRRFHETIISACCSLVESIAGENPGFGRRVVLSGGSMNNPFLSLRLSESLEARGFSVYTHHLLPSGDGGLCLGQLMIAAAKSGVSKACDDDRSDTRPISSSGGNEIKKY